MSNFFEFEYNGKTYSTVKHCRAMTGAISIINAKALRESGISQEELNSAAHEEWATQLFGSILLQDGPAILWRFLTPESKKDIGIFSDFNENIDGSVLGKFTEWVANHNKKVQDFLPQKPVEETGAAPSQNVQQTPSSAGSTDGQTMTSPV